MNDETCRFEQEILEGEWTDELRAHVTSCEDCAAAAAVAPWMERFASLSDREHILPHPSIVWLKAQVLRNGAEAARLSRPMNVAQLVAYCVVAAGWAAAMTWKWTAIERLLTSFTATRLAAGDTPLASLPTFVALLLLATVTVTLAMHTILADE
jgi:hypothetical protein